MSNELDIAFMRFAATSPIIPPGLSNHGPMVVEVLDHMGRHDAIADWTDKYLAILDARPNTRRPLEADDWAGALGDHDRLGDWLRFFEIRVERSGWQEVLRGWLPRLMPGMESELGHGPIRTFHAARALGRHESEARINELTMALGFWAAWYRRSTTSSETVLPTWQPEQALDSMIEAGAGWFLERAALDSAVVLAHAVTIPRAVRELLPWLKREQQEAAARLAEQAYRSLGYGFSDQPAPPVNPPAGSIEQLFERAVANGDPHAIKFTEACLEEHGRTGAHFFLAAASEAAGRLTSQSALFRG